MLTLSTVELRILGYLTTDMRLLEATFSLYRLTAGSEILSVVAGRDHRRDPVTAIAMVISIERTTPISMSALRRPSNLKRDCLTIFQMTALRMSLGLSRRPTSTPSPPRARRLRSDSPAAAPNYQSLYVGLVCGKRVPCAATDFTALSL